MTQARSDLKITLNDGVRFFLELFSVFSLGLWGFIAWPLPWNIVVGILAPLVAIVLWALFRSPKAVFSIDPFGRALVEIVVLASAAFAWWDLGLPIVAIAFAAVATVSGIVNGRREFR